MKFLCDSCGTKYAISDERVRGRVLKIRCKKCDFVITVREDAAAAADSVGLPSADELGQAFDAALGGGGEEKTTLGDLGSADLGASTAPDPPRTPVKPDDDWYVSFDGEQEGPFDLARAIERVRAENGSGKEAHAWRPGYMVWLPVEEIPDLEAALRSRITRTPVRSMTATPIGNGRGGSGAVAAHIAKDPSGPRAALAVSAGAQRSQGVSAHASSGLSSHTGSSGLFSGATSSPAAAVAPAPMFPAAARSSNNPPTLDPDELVLDPSDPNIPLPAPADSAPELPISNEASGLMNLDHLRAAAMGMATGPGMVNGHTGSQRLPSGQQPRMQSAQHARLQTGRQRTLEPLSSLDSFDAPSENPSTAAPVVVMAGLPQGGTSPIFKWAALVAFVACLGLGGGVWYLLTHRPAAETIIVTEPSRHQDDTAITVTDPVTGKTVAVAPDPKHAATGPVAKKIAAAPPTKGGPVAKGDGMSGSQKALADLYKDDGDKATPHAVVQSGHEQAQGGQVNQSAILAVVSQNRRALNLCYERVLKHDNSLKQGRVVVQVAVGISGRVTSVTIPDAQYATSELGQCFTQAVKRWNFPSSDAPYATEFPFILQGQ